MPSTAGATTSLSNSRPRKRHLLSGRRLQELRGRPTALDPEHPFEIGPMNRRFAPHCGRGRTRRMRQIRSSTEPGFNYRVRSRRRAKILALGAHRPPTSAIVARACSRGARLVGRSDMEMDSARLTQHCSILCSTSRSAVVTRSRRRRRSSQDSREKIST